MCGVCGYLGSDIEAGAAFASRGVRLLSHRGPDDHGVFVGDRVSLGHTRLAIVELSSAGHQPMTSDDGRWTIVYNGEVYNHRELRETRCGGWRFHGGSDTETVLACIALHGPAALEWMVGMWAFLCWDARERVLLVARDRYGQKPLHWRRGRDSSLRFASEIRPLLDESERPAPFVPAVAEYLATGNYGHLRDRTFFEDIRSFPPGHWARLEPGDKSVEPVRYWRFPADQRLEPKPYDKRARDSFRERLEGAVRSQLMSDLPVGATLSGGLDSSVVVGLMTKFAPGPIEVFTAQAYGSRLDESRYVRAVGNKWGKRLRLHWVNLHHMSFQSTLRRGIRSQEEPFGDPSILAHGLLMDAAREVRVPVVLGGQGADELLFGYPFMWQSLLAGATGRGKLAWALCEANALGMDSTSVARVALASAFPRLADGLRMLSRARTRAGLSARLRRGARDFAPRFARVSDTSAVWREAVERVALPHLLHYDDRNAMARSIEGRMPFLDHRLADELAPLTAEAWLHQGRTKRILRDACTDLLPPEVLSRRDKLGFYTPLHALVRSEAPWIRAIIADGIARSVDFYDRDRAIRDLESVVSGREDHAGLRLWRALSVRIWAEEFSVSGSW